MKLVSDLMGRDNFAHLKTSDSNQRLQTDGWFDLTLNFHKSVLDQIILQGRPLVLPACLAYNHSILPLMRMTNPVFGAFFAFDSTRIRSLNAPCFPASMVSSTLAV